ncbi:MAG: carbon storage regulator [Candidatus Sedimenticola sp. 6PFRAG7]
MLILGRRVHQPLVLILGEQKVVIRVEETTYKQAKLSFDAPKDLLIMREELLQEMGRSEAVELFVNKNVVDGTS